MEGLKHFGDGWLTANAADLCKIAILFGGYDASELVLTIHKLQKGKSAKANVATVEHALQAILDAAVAADPESYADVIESRKQAQEYFNKLHEEK